MLAALHAIAALGGSELSLSKLLQPYARYVASGEINSKVADGVKKISEIKELYQTDNETDELDGLTVSGDSWWFNVRASNTEPLLRLNVEARNEAQMAEIRDRLLKVIRS